MYEEINRYVHQLIAQSSTEQTAWNVEKLRNGIPASWNYIDGCMMTALLSLSEITGDQTFADFTEHFIDAFVNEDGSIRTYAPEKHTLDDINAGRAPYAGGQLLAQDDLSEPGLAGRGLYGNAVSRPV